MCSRPFQKSLAPGHPGYLQLLLPAVVLVSICAVTSHGQRPGISPARDLVRSIERKEMDRLLLLKPIPAISNDPARKAMLRQISQDFKDMQGLNNKMMAEIWAKDAIDYEDVSGTIGQIRERANRLKANLLLPEIKQDKKPPMDAATAKEFRGVLLRLDQSIMSFVTNPLFQKANVIDVNLATKAHRDLVAVIDLSGFAKKIAGKLSQTSKQTQ